MHFFLNTLNGKTVYVELGTNTRIHADSYAADHAGEAPDDWGRQRSHSSNTHFFLNTLNTKAESSNMHFFLNTLKGKAMYAEPGADTRIHTMRAPPQVRNQGGRIACAVNHFKTIADMQHGLAAEPSSRARRPRHQGAVPTLVFKLVLS